MNLRLYPFGALVIFLILFTSCTRFPRIVVLEDPLTAEEHIQLGHIYEGQKKYDLAIKEYRLALKKNPNLNQARVNLGNALMAKKEYGEAEKAYLQALAAEPENADILNNLAWLYLEKRERLSEAEVLARRALELKPSSRMYYLDTLGMALLLQGKPLEAEKAFLQALEAIPEKEKFLKAEVYYHLALVYQALGKQKELEEAMEQIRALDLEEYAGKTEELLQYRSSK